MKKKLINFLRKRFDYISFLIISISLVLIKLSDIGQSLKNKIQIASTLDFSWQTDMVERFLHGFIAGRDFIFTYGPIYQILESLPSVVLGIPSYASILYSQIFLLSIVGILCFLIAKLISKNKKDQVLILILLLSLTIFNSHLLVSNLIRIFIPLAYSFLFLKLQTEKLLSFRSLGILVLPSLFGLYSFDLFLSCIAMIGIFTIYDLITILINPSSKLAKRVKAKQTVLRGIYLFLTVFSFEMLVSFILSRNLNYLYYSLDTISNYQFIMNIPFSFNKAYVLFIFPMISFFVLVYGLANRYFDSDLKRKLIFLSFTALLSLKSAITRADEGHILTGVYPSIIVLFLILYFISRKSRKILIAFSVFIFLFIIFIFKQENHPQISIRNINYAIHGIKEEMNFSKIYKLPKNYHYIQTDLNYFESLISKNPGEVMVYPYDTFILNMDNQTYNVLPLQFYQYSNSLVEKKAIDLLSISPPKFIIYSIDGKGVIPLDNVPNFSRNSLLTKWIINNYKVHSNLGNYLILRNDNSGPIYKDKNCNLFSINPKSIRENGLMGLLKPSTYYLGDENNLRLPITNSNEDILTFNGFSDSVDMENLINSNVNFSIYIESREDNLSVLKKYPFPLITKVHQSLKVNCY